MVTYNSDLVNKVFFGLPLIIFQKSCFNTYQLISKIMIGEYLLYLYKININLVLSVIIGKNYNLKFFAKIRENINKKIGSCVANANNVFIH